VALYKKWCDAAKEKNQRKQYWTLVEKDGGRDESVMLSRRLCVRIMSGSNASRTT
jgi:hypothetical protein